MRIPRVSLAVALPAVLAATASAGMWRWQRKLEFAKALCTRQYYDIGDRVIARLESDKSIIGIEKAFLHRDLGLFVQYLDKSRACFLKFLGHASIKTNPRYGSDRFDIGLRLSRIQLAIAEGHVRELDNDRLAKAEKEKHKKQAVTILKAAIAAFDRAVGEKAKGVSKVKGLAPPATADAALRNKWRERYRIAREELFRVRLERNVSRVRFAQLLKQVKAAASEWQAQLATAEKDDATVAALQWFVKEQEEEEESAEGVVRKAQEAGDTAEGLARLDEELSQRAFHPPKAS